MVLYLLKRLLAMIPTLLGITLVTFIIINLEPNQSRTKKAYKSAVAISTSQESGEVKLEYFRFKIDK